MYKGWLNTGEADHTRAHTQTHNGDMQRARERQQCRLRTLLALLVLISRTTGARATVTAAAASISAAPTPSTDHLTKPAHPLSHTAVRSACGSGIGASWSVCYARSHGLIRNFLRPFSAFCAAKAGHTRLSSPSNLHTRFIQGRARLCYTPTVYKRRRHRAQEEQAPPTGVCGMSAFREAHAQSLLIAG